MRNYVEEVLASLPETPDSTGMLGLMKELPYEGHCHYCHADPVSCMVLGAYNECMDCRVKRLTEQYFRETVRGGRLRG